MSQDNSFKYITCIIITGMACITYRCSLPTTDEDIIKAHAAACITEKKLKKYEIDFNACVTENSSATHRNNCVYESAAKNGLNTYTNDSNLYNIDSSVFSDYQSDKKLSMIPLKNGKQYNIECQIW